MSPDHDHLALLVDTNGYEDFVLRVKDLRTGEFLPDTADSLGFGLAWASDGRTLFYETTDESKRADRVWRHRLGEPRAADAAVYHDPDPLFNVGVRRSRSGAFIFLTSSSFTSTRDVAARRACAGERAAARGRRAHRTSSTTWTTAASGSTCSRTATARATSR